MPAQSTQTAISTAQVAVNTLTLDTIKDVIQVFGPFLTVISGLIIWAYKKIEKSQDKLEKAFIAHVEEDDNIHDKIFTQSRVDGEKLANLIGEHNATHKKES